MTDEPVEKGDPDQKNSGPGRQSPSSFCRTSTNSVKCYSHRQGHGASRCFEARGGRAENKQGSPVTKLSHLVKDIKTKSLEEI